MPTSFYVTMEMKMLYVCLKMCEVNWYTDNMELHCSSVDLSYVKCNLQQDL